MPHGAVFILYKAIFNEKPHWMSRVEFEYEVKIREMIDD